MGKPGINGDQIARYTYVMFREYSAPVTRLHKKHERAEDGQKDYYSTAAKSKITHLGIIACEFKNLSKEKPERSWYIIEGRYQRCCCLLKLRPCSGCLSFFQQ
jgi:hypothetical protein